MNSGQGKKSIELLAKDFIQDMMNKKIINHRQARNAVVLEKYILQHSSSSTISTEIANLISQIESSDIRQKLQCLIGRAISSAGLVEEPAINLPGGDQEDIEDIAVPLPVIPTAESESCVIQVSL